MPKLRIHQKRRGTLRRKIHIKNTFPFDSARIRSPTEEIKLFPLTQSGAYFDAAAGQTIIDLTQITQGVSGAQRVGDVARLVRLHVSLLLNNGVGATANARTISRVIFFQYLGDNSVANKPTIIDFLQTNANNAGNTYGSFSTYDIDYGRQYRVLWDSGMILTIGTNGLAALGVPPVGVYHKLDFNIPLKRAQRDLAFYTGGITGPNHIFMLLTSDQATIATNPTYNITSEARFTDA